MSKDTDEQAKAALMESIANGLSQESISFLLLIDNVMNQQGTAGHLVDSLVRQERSMMRKKMAKARGYWIGEPDDSQASAEDSDNG